MKKKYDFNLIAGVILLSFGSITAAYSIIAIVFNVFFEQSRIFLYAKDILFDIVFILLGLMLIRKKKQINRFH